MKRNYILAFLTVVAMTAGVNKAKIFNVRTVPECWYFKYMKSLDCIMCKLLPVYISLEKCAFSNVMISKLRITSEQGNIFFPGEGHAFQKVIARVKISYIH